MHCCHSVKSAPSKRLTNRRLYCAVVEIGCGRLSERNHSYMSRPMSCLVPSHRARRVWQVQRVSASDPLNDGAAREAWKRVLVEVNHNIDTPARIPSKNCTDHRATLCRIQASHLQLRSTRQSHWIHRQMFFHIVPGSFPKLREELDGLSFWKS